jgi:hypothetical protein
MNAEQCDKFLRESADYYTARFYPDLAKDYIACADELARLRGLLQQVADSVPAFEDSRLSYFEPQIDADLFNSLRKEFGSPEPETQTP